MKDVLGPLTAIAVLSLVEKIFGRGASMSLALIVIAFAVGVFWEAGRNKRAHVTQSEGE